MRQTHRLKLNNSLSNRRKAHYADYGPITSPGSNHSAPRVRAEKKRGELTDHELIIYKGLERLTQCSWTGSRSGTVQNWLI